MSKHTLGPWSVDAEDADLFAQETHRIWINADGMHIGYVDGPRNPERNANARLIAAAPDLLDALVDVMFRHVPFSDKSPYAEKARAAIAKATGEKK